MEHRTRSCKRIAGAATSALVAGVAFVACGSSYTPSATARSAFVDARAQALCTVKDKTFNSEQALEAAYTKSQSAAISDKDNQWLKSHLEKDAQLRGDITARFDALCPGDPNTAAKK